MKTYVVNNLFIVLLDLPDPVARSACDVLNPQIGGARPNRDAIIAGSNSGVEDRDTARGLHMNAISVWAVSRGRHSYTFHFYVVATIDDDMKHLAVQ